jgi:hypothetical protein
MKICLYLFDLSWVISVLKLFLSKLQGTKALALFVLSISDKEKKFITLTQGVILVSEKRTKATVSRNSRNSNSSSGLKKSLKSFNKSSTYGTNPSVKFLSKIQENVCIHLI